MSRFCSRSQTAHQRAPLLSGRQGCLAARRFVAAHSTGRNRAIVEKPVSASTGQLAHCTGGSHEKAGGVWAAVSAPSAVGAVAAALLLLGSAQPAWSKEKADKAAPPEVVRGVPRVVDGDTLAIDTRRIRLFGVDAPEKAQSCQRHKGKGSYSCGMDSQHALEEHLKGQTVACEVQRLDQYGRSVAACTLPNGEDLSAWLVQSGNAVAYRKYSGEKYVALETEAKKAERGIWASDFTMPAEYRRQHHKHGG